VDYSVARDRRRHSQRAERRDCRAKRLENGVLHLDLVEGEARRKRAAKRRRVEATMAAKAAGSDPENEAPLAR
jgi:hypothetical protein